MHRAWLHLWWRFQERLFGLPVWDAQRIQDEWFRAHFYHAADTVHAWLDAHVGWPRAKLLNFGCGDGITDLSLVLRHGARYIHGVDIRHEYRKLARIASEQLGMRRLPAALRFETIVPGSALAPRHQNYDGLLSWSTFEHVQRDQLLPILADLCQCLRPGGVFFLQIEPLYHSPWGSHLGRYGIAPWQHLRASGQELWDMIARHEGPLNADEVDFGFADFGAEGYKEFVFREYRSLNRLSADELVQIAQQAGFAVLREERRHVDLPVPEDLQQRWPRELLLNNEILLLLGRPG